MTACIVDREPIFIISHDIKIVVILRSMLYFKLALDVNENNYNIYNITVLSLCWDLGLHQWM